MSAWAKRAWSSADSRMIPSSSMTRSAASCAALTTKSEMLRPFSAAARFSRA
jgi:hypothetical protein